MRGNSTEPAFSPEQLPVERWQACLYDLVSRSNLRTWVSCPAAGVLRGAGVTLCRYFLATDLTNKGTTIEFSLLHTNARAGRQNDQALAFLLGFSTAQNGRESQRYSETSDTLQKEDAQPPLKLPQTSLMELTLWGHPACGSLWNTEGIIDIRVFITKHQITLEAKLGLMLEEAQLEPGQLSI